MVDFSTPEGKALFESEVRRRMDAPINMERTKAEMLVAMLLWTPATAPADPADDPTTSG